MPKVKSGICQTIGHISTHKERAVNMAGEGSLDTRNRATIQVQMDLNKAKERELVEYYKGAAKGKSWKADFMDGLRLLISLRKDNLKVLRVLFPHLANAWELFEGIQNKNFAAFKEFFPDLYGDMRIAIREELESQSRNKAYQELLEEMKVLRAKLESLQSTQALSMPQSGNGIKQLNTKAIAAPSFDDDDDLVLGVGKDENAGAKANQNFINSMMALQK